MLLWPVVCLFINYSSYNTCIARWRIMCFSPDAVMEWALLWHYMRIIEPFEKVLLEMELLPIKGVVFASIHEMGAMPP